MAVLFLFMPSRDHFLFSFIAPMLAFLTLIFWMTTAYCDGHFFYSLDDPYITLSLARHIAHGHYGINDGEFSSPSSAIVYPFLLALFARLPGFVYAPVILNGISCLATIAIVAQQLRKYGIVVAPAHVAPGVILVVGFALATNLVGVTFTGLEHSVHILLSVAVVFGLASVAEGEAPAVWLLSCLIALPLIRFEGAALALAGIIFLLRRGRRREAIVVAVALVVIFSAWGTAMRWLGLPFLPSSVLVKLQPFSFAELLARFRLIVACFRAPLTSEPSFLFVVLTALVAFTTAITKTYRDFGLSILFALAAQFAVGSWGWFYRYEIYSFAIAGVALIVLTPSSFRWIVSHGPFRSVGVVAILLLLGWKYALIGTFMTPSSAQDVYLQQGQMRRFAQDFYRRPVGVNDLGLVSFDNHSYVLDLWGLGSEAARRARMVTHERGWLERLTQAHNVGVVMIYEPWFPAPLPSSWHRIAQLRVTSLCLASGGRIVSFFATSDRETRVAISALHAFAATVPHGTVVTVAEP